MPRPGKPSSEDGSRQVPPSETSTITANFAAGAGGGIGAAEVEFHARGLHALDTQIGEQGLHFLGAAAPGHLRIVGVIPGEVDRGPGGGEAARRGRADADGAASAGDDGEFARKVQGYHARRSLR